jgi:anaerobic dimethyl sulfoxide reductase subunit B (iron-sulfur subunit)
MQLGFYFNQSRCIGCYTCVIACKDWHDVGGGISWIRIKSIEKGKFPHLNLSYLFFACLHCSNPVCMKACPVNAITKREENGVVVVNKESCLGGEKCKYACRKACPYDAPQFGAEANAKMQKCEFCLDRWEESKNPICVDACPMRALDARPLDELAAKYGNFQKVEGFRYSKKVGPSIILKPKV